MMARRDAISDLRLARERADLARTRFRRRLAAVRERVAPAQLKADAGQALMARVQDGKAAARRAFWRRPWLTSAVMAGTAALLFRKPLARLGRKGKALIEELEEWHRRRQEAEQHGEEGWDDEQQRD